MMDCAFIRQSAIAPCAFAARSANDARLSASDSHLPLQFHSAETQP